MVPIRENLLSSAKYDLKVPVESCAKDMKYIVVHNTANDASAANEVAYMIRNDSSTSFNAAVDDKEIVIDRSTRAHSQRANVMAMHMVFISRFAIRFRAARVSIKPRRTRRSISQSCSPSANGIFRM